MANAFVHNELNTQDVGKAKAFYGKLFDWTLEDMSGGMEYTLIKVGEGTAGGIMKHPVPGAPPVLSQRVHTPAAHHPPAPNRPVEYASSDQSAIITGFQPSAILKQTIPRHPRRRAKSP